MGNSALTRSSESSPAGSGWRPLDTLSLGGWIILAIAVVSTVAVMVWPIHRESGLELWTFAKPHGELYDRLSEDYNRQAEAKGELPYHVSVIDGGALTRRTLSGFWSGTPLADLIEIDRNVIGRFMSGPVEDVGFLDLTDRIEAEGLMEQINAPSFGPWTSRQRIFALPHDVHPVLLCYRSDLVEQAGIDVSRIETWDDFARVMKPLIADLDGDGNNDRYLLNLWYSSGIELEALMLQAGGGTFDADDQSLIASDANAMVLAQMVAWMVGPNRIAIDAPQWSASGNQMRLEGRVIAQIMPDWLSGTWAMDMPGLGGKLKLMPLPAWKPGGLRTSVYGGTGLGIPKTSPDIEAAWDVAKHLYLAPDLAEELYRTGRIISPVRRFWDEPFYQEPDPYFSGQRHGQLYIEQAPHVPFRSSSPYHPTAMGRISEALTTLYNQTRDGEIVPINDIDAAALRPRAAELLKVAEQRVLQEISRNVFLDPEQTDAADQGAGDEQ